MHLFLFVHLFVHFLSVYLFSFLFHVHLSANLFIFLEADEKITYAARSVGMRINEPWQRGFRIGAGKPPAFLLHVTDDETNKLETKSLFLMYKIYNNETKGEIIDVVETSTFGTTAMKNGINLTEWQQIKFMNFSYKIFMFCDIFINLFTEINSPSF